ncbi:F510_1955 family glycosylhydrolase [Paenibacillus tarimensis]
MKNRWKRAVTAFTIAVIIIGTVACSQERNRSIENTIPGGDNRETENANSGNVQSGDTDHVSEVSMHHAHGMSYSPDGSKIYFAVHDGLRIYENGQWKLPAGERHDYMGFSMTDDGFYSSGHPAPGSDKKNPLGIIKSTDEGRSFTPLAFYGQVDFHGLSVGYKSHAIYVYNPEPNPKMETLGLYYSTDEADSWTKSAMSGLEGQPEALAVHSADEAIVAVGTSEGIFVSSNYGDRFEKIGPEMRVTSLYFNVEGALLAGAVNKQPAFVRIDPETKQTEELKIPALKEDLIAFVGQSPVNEKDIAFMTMHKDVYISSDGGDTWSKIADKGIGKSVQVDP